MGRLFIRHETNPVYVIMFVDELLVVGSRLVVDRIKTFLPRLFTVMDLGQCSYFLEIKIDS